jgi:hypothetical protein
VLVALAAATPRPARADLSRDGAKFDGGVYGPDGAATFAALGTGTTLRDLTIQGATDAIAGPGSVTLVNCRATVGGA